MFTIMLLNIISLLRQHCLKLETVYQKNEFLILIAYVENCDHFLFLGSFYNLTQRHLFESSLQDKIACKIFFASKHTHTLCNDLPCEG